MWTKIASFFIEKIIGGLIQMWESNKRDAANIEKGADIVVKEQLKDETEKAKRAVEVSDDVRTATDDELDDGMRRPSKRSGR